MSGTRGSEESGSTDVLTRRACMNFYACLCVCMNVYVYLILTSTCRLVQALVYLVVNGYEGVVWRKGPGAALAMHQQRLHLALHHVLLHLHKSIRNDRLARKFRVRVRARVREKDKSPPGDAIIMQYIPSIYLPINPSIYQSIYQSVTLAMLWDTS